MKNQTNRPRTGLASVEAGDSGLTDRTTLARAQTALAASEAGLADDPGAVEIRTATAEATSDAQERVAQRLAQITARSPKRARLFRSVYYGKPSRTRAIKAKCLDCSGWQVAEIRDCTSVTCPLWRVRPYQDGRSRKMQAPGKRFWRRTTPARVKTAEVA